MSPDLLLGFAAGGALTLIVWFAVEFWTFRRQQRRKPRAAILPPATRKQLDRAQRFNRLELRIAYPFTSRHDSRDDREVN